MDERAIGVVGAGLMGVGIAVQLARHGHAVILVENDAPSRERVAARAGEILDELDVAGRLADEERACVLARIETVADLEPLAPVGLVIEAIPERLALKHALYRRLEEILADDAVIASNTSGFTPESLAEGMRHPERLLIAHFWNPPHFITLVELVPGEATRREYLADVERLLAGAGLEPVALSKAIPGFVGNRLQFAVLREALAIVAAGAATPEQVDQVMRSSLGRRYAMLGPFEAADQGGLDTFLDISRHLMPCLAHDQTALTLLEARVERGQLGARPGQGFYHWDQHRRDALTRARQAALARDGVKSGMKERTEEGERR